MKLALVGVGSAGGRIVNRIRAHERATDRDLSGGNVLVIDTEDPDGLDAIPEDRRVVMGETDDRVDGRGVDGDLELAVEVTEAELDEVRRAFDTIEPYELDGLLLVAGLGGGTGSGAGAVVLEELQAIYEKPVYALGVLPAAQEGGRAALNAARGLRSFVPEADNVVLFDNDAWPSGETGEAGGDGEDGEDSEYEQANREAAIRVAGLLGAGELDGTRVAENAIDSSDLIRTLATGGVSSIGYASTAVDTPRGGLLGWLLDRLFGADEGEAADPKAVKRLVRRATGELSVPCAVSSAERTLVVLSGPPSALSRRGFEEARYWLEEEADTVEVLAGDEPNERADELSVAVLLSNVTDVPRIEAIQDRALEHQRDEFCFEGEAVEGEQD